MNVAEGKAQFIQTWGKLGTEWGISRTVAQCHALLLIADRPLSAEEIMDELSISRGNANMSLRDLIGWQLIEKVLVPGERREYFQAEKDIWEVARRVMRERKRRELEPVLTVLEKLKEVKPDSGEKASEAKAFTDTVNDLRKFIKKANNSADMLLKADENWFFGTLLKAFK